eukprot:5531880-Prymnesium_polylepis.1
MEEAQLEVTDGTSRNRRNRSPTYIGRLELCSWASVHIAVAVKMVMTRVAAGHIIPQWGW